MWRLWGGKKVISFQKLTASSSFFVIVHVSTPYGTTGPVSVLLEYNRILVLLDKSRLLKRLIAAK
jgi:hypothetical protein